MKPVAASTQKARPRGLQGPDRKGRDSGKKPREGPADSGATPAKRLGNDGISRGRLVAAGGLVVTAKKVASSGLA